MKRIVVLLITISLTAAEVKSTKGKADLGDFMLHYESSAESAAVALYGRGTAPSVSVTKEKDKAPVTVIWFERDGVATFYTDTDGDGIIDQALIRRTDGTRKYKIKMEMSEIGTETK